MISHLVELLREGGVADPGPDELADILWLAREVLPSGTDPEPGETVPVAPGAADDGQPVAEGLRADPVAGSPGDTVRGKRPGLRAYGRPARDRTGAETGPPVPVPAEAALPQALALTRSLKALTRKVPSDTAFELDEEATVTRLADENILVPVVRPEPARWLSLALVVDTSSSMALWHDEVREIQSGLTRLGAFRDIRRWHLTPRDDGSAVELRLSPSATPGARHPREVAAPGGRQLVLVLSDMVGAVWRTGAASRLLLEWSRRTQVAVAHLLPAALWRRGAVVPRPALLHLPGPGMPNSRWNAVFPGLRHAPGAHPPFAVPVLELEPGPLRAWAELTAGSGRWISTAALPLPQPVRPARPPDATAPLSPAEAIERFRRSSSPASWRLAGFLSALTTVTVPVARLVQRSLLPGSSRGDLAEVLLGGLLRRSGTGALHFAFPPEIADALRYAQRDRDVREVRSLVREQVSARLETRYGSPRAFTGVLTGVAGAAATAEASGEAFATPSPAAVERLGHGAGGEERERERVFISYAAADRAWAEWVAAHLQVAGHEVLLDTWHMAAGESFPLRIAAFLRDATVMVALFSPHYFRSPEHALTEWLPVLAPSLRVLPLAVAPYPDEEVPGTLRVLNTTELYGLRESRAKDVLLGAVEEATRRGRRGAPGPADGGGPHLWSAPSRNEAFVGREGTLRSIRDGLFSGDRPAVRALVGAEGTGTSQIALEYVHRHLGRYGLVWWIPAWDQDDVVLSYAELAGRLRPRGFGEDIVENARLGLEALRTSDRWLIILDGAAGPETVREWLPEGPGHVLVTSRDPAWREAAPVIEVGALSRAESLAYLHRRQPGLTTEQAGALAAATGGLPAVLERAVGHFSIGVDPDDYLSALQLRDEDDSDVARSFLVDLALDRLEDAEPEAVRLLAAFARLGPQPIPETWADLPEGRPWSHESLRTLARLGLVRLDHGSFQVDPLARSIVPLRVHEGGAVPGTPEPETLLAAVCPDEPRVPAHWGSWKTLTGHLIASGLLVAQRPEGRRMMLGSVRYLLESGAHRDAAALVSGVHTAWAEAFGRDDPATLRCASLLAESLYALGEYSRARDVAEEELAWSLRVLGADHRDTLRLSGRLSVALHGLGQYEEAERTQADTVHRCHRVLGDDHPDTIRADLAHAILLHPLGRLHDMRGHADAAVLRGLRVLGADHPDTLRAAATLGSALHTLGESQEALRVQQDVLDRRRRVLGEAHPDTLRTAVGLGVTLKGIGEHTRARGLLEDALTGLVRVLGEDHPDVLPVSHNLGIVLRELGEYRAAESMLRDTRSRSARLLGSGHPRTRLTTEALASVLTATGRPFEAQRLLARIPRRKRRGTK
ncbi:FxSxx-COOH system tetratricopeptide repeat protein [Streptomyces sp. HD1123-B1]|uniref:FxSxx-COOH system tetratricopeptide repeat protein n=1 Tax=Streptomyces huangiella TaxID=3228804 RepID=UPI003D7D1949